MPRRRGSTFVWLSAPVRVVGNDDGVVTGVRVQRMELGEPDRSGRPRPMPIDGQRVRHRDRFADHRHRPGCEPSLTHATKELEVDSRGRIVTEDLTQMTSMPGVFAGGDIVTGAATVILAMGAGKLAGASIDAWLRGVPLVADAETGEVREEGGKPAVVADIAEHRMGYPAHA